MQDNIIILENAPNITGLIFRHFLGEADSPAMIKILDAASAADQEDEAHTEENLRREYKHLTNSDPYQDMVFAEIDGEPIAYARVEWWQEEDPNDLVYGHFVNIVPDWRDQGIELAIIRWCETRLRRIAEEHPKDRAHVYQTYSNEFKPTFNDLLESLHYQPARYFIEMSRPLEDIPQANLPEGIAVRPVGKDQARQVWDASNDAFRDHWGYSEPKEEHYRSYLESKYFQPELWQVAWDGDEVVSSVMNYIDHDYNEKFNRKRGWTENISTRKAWRRRGIAKALIVQSMHMHKALGMTSVGLGVDTKNPLGALKLYQDLGYQEEKTWITFRKPL